MNKAIKVPLCCILLFTTIWLWAISCAYAGYAQTRNDRVTLHCSTSPLSLQDVKAMRTAEMRTKKPKRFVAWNQKDAQTVSFSDYHRTAMASILQIYGDSDLLLPSQATLFTEDNTGCLIDRRTAYALFGDENPVGAALTYEGREYTVRGVLDAPESTVLISAQQDDSAALNRITLDLTDEQNLRGAAEGFAMRHNFYPDFTDLGGHTVLSAVTSRLPLLLAGGAMICSLLRIAHDNRRKPVLRMLYWCGALLMVAAVCWLGGIRLSIPPDMLPTRWSDFSFWSRLFESKKTALLDYLFMKKERPDIWLLQMNFISIISGVLAGILFRFASRHITVKDGKQLVQIIIVSLFCSFLAILFVGRYHPLPGQTMLWLTLLFYFAEKWGVGFFPVRRHIL